MIWLSGTVPGMIRLRCRMLTIILTAGVSWRVSCLPTGRSGVWTRLNAARLLFIPILILPAATAGRVTVRLPCLTGMRRFTEARATTRFMRATVMILCSAGTGMIRFPVRPGMTGFPAGTGLIRFTAGTGMICFTAVPGMILFPAVRVMIRMCLIWGTAVMLFPSGAVLMF